MQDKKILKTNGFYGLVRKLSRLVINIDIFLQLLIIIYALLVLLNYPAAFYIGIVILLLFMFASLFPGGQWLCVWLENRIPLPLKLPANIEGIFILGSGFDQQVTLARKVPSYNLHLGRLVEFVRLAKLYPNTKLVFSGGGRFAAPEANEALLASNLFKLCGLELHRVIFENQARDTNQNITNSFKLLKPTQERPWVLVTSALHMPRALCLCKKIGWDVIPYPVDYRTTGKPQYINLSPLLGFCYWYMAMQELMEMLMNYIFGYSDEFYPRVMH